MLQRIQVPYPPYLVRLLVFDLNSDGKNIQRDITMCIFFRDMIEKVALTIRVLFLLIKCVFLVIYFHTCGCSIHIVRVIYNSCCWVTSFVMKVIFVFSLIIVSYALFSLICTVYCIPLKSLFPLLIKFSNIIL